MCVCVCVRVCTYLNPTLVLHTPQDTSAQESDPCHNYTVLNDTWRATTNQDGLHRCDSDVQWQGWYRMFHQGASVLMPNVCVPYLRCGTHAPLWLNGSHPRPEDGIVTREVCGSYLGCCSYKPPSIQVKACPGNYTVYKLVDPLNCNLAYCTGKMLFSDIFTIVCLCPCYIHHCFSWEKIFISHIYYLKHISIRHADETTATIPAAVTNPAPTTPSKRCSNQEQFLCFSLWPVCQITLLCIVRFSFIPSYMSFSYMSFLVCLYHFKLFGIYYCAFS